MQPIGLRSLIQGDHAFYEQLDYMKVTQKEMGNAKALPESSSWTTGQDHSSLHFLHRLAGKVALLPASSPTLLGYPSDYAVQLRKKIPLEDGWLLKRFTLSVEGHKVDAVIMGWKESFKTNRWVLVSNGNGEFYEEKLTTDRSIKKLIAPLNANAILFNYPGVGASTGTPNRELMKKTYLAFLNLLEDAQKGLGAKEIIGFGHSIGGGVQNDALRGHSLKNDIKYVFVKSRTFADLRGTASALTHESLGLIVDLLDWNMDNKSASKGLRAPEIILQTARVKKSEILTDSSKIIDDGIVPAHGSLGKALLDDETCPKQNKVFIGVPERHNQSLQDVTLLAQTIIHLLNTQ